METNQSELYFVFMNFDPEYDRLRANCRRNKGGKEYEVDKYVSKKHDELLSRYLDPGSYFKTSSLVIVDGFAAHLTPLQASVLRSAKEVRLVEKNQELA